MIEKNSNVNTNNSNINIKVDARPKRTYTKKKSEPNWYARTIIGGIIALLLSIAGYYIKNNLNNGGSKTNAEPVNSSNQIQPN
jgi:hypothetical protein